MMQKRFRLKLDRERNRLVILGPNKDEGSMCHEPLDTIDMIEIMSDSPTTSFTLRLYSPPIAPSVPLDDTNIEAWILAS